MRTFGTEIRTWLPKPQAATIIVAASDSLHPERADYHCNGIADDEDIQAAIDALPPSGGKVLLLEGNYDITATIEIGNNTTLTGVGSGTVLRLANAVTATMITNKDATPESRSATENLNITLCDMYIDGNKDNQGAGLDSLWCVGFSTVQNLRIENITVVDGWTTSIRTEFCTYVVVANNRVHNSGDDNIAINEETFYASVYGNTISDAGQGAKTYGSPCGIEVQDGTYNVSVYGNEIYNSLADGIQVSTHPTKSACHDVSIVGNTIRTGDRHGIAVTGIIGELLHDVIVDGNTVYDTERGIYLDHTYNITISSNSIDAADEDGIYTYESTNCTLNGNVIRDVFYMGIHLLGNSLYNSISNNICVDNGRGVSFSQVGIGLSDTCNYNTIIGNVCRDTRVGAARTQEYGIILYATALHNYIAHNILINNSNLNYRDVSNDPSNIHTHNYPDLFMDVLAVSATHVVDDWDVSAAGEIELNPAAANQPDVPRTLSWTFVDHTNVTEYDLVFEGVDAKGSIITETFTEVDLWAGETSNAFATISAIKYTRQAGAGDAGNIFDIGITDVLGLSNIIYETGDVYKIKKNPANVAVATAQVNTTYDTYDMAVIGLAAGDDFTIWFKSNLNIIS